MLEAEKKLLAFKLVSVLAGLHLNCVSNGETFDIGASLEHDPGS